MGEVLTLELEQKAAARELLAARRARARQGRLLQQPRRRGDGAHGHHLGHVPEIDIFSIDTGRLHEETYELLEKLERRYQAPHRASSTPTPKPLEQLRRARASTVSTTAWRRASPAATSARSSRSSAPSPATRAWVTGVRRAAVGDARARRSRVEWDAPNGLYKVSPLLDWTEAGGVGSTSARASCRTTRCTIAVSQHRLRALHARHPAGRGSARRPLVVGEPGIARVRPAAAASRDSAQGRAAPSGRCGHLTWTTLPIFLQSRRRARARRRRRRSRRAQESICCCEPARRSGSIAPELVTRPRGAEQQRGEIDARRDASSGREHLDGVRLAIAATDKRAINAVGRAAAERATCR